MWFNPQTSSSFVDLQINIQSSDAEVNYFSVLPAISWALPVVLCWSWSVTQTEGSVSAPASWGWSHTCIFPLHFPWTKKNAHGLMPWDCSAVVITVIYWCVLALGLSITCSNQSNLTQCSAKVLQPQPLVLCKKSLQLLYQSNSSLLRVCLVWFCLKKSFAFAGFFCLVLKSWFKRVVEWERPVCAASNTLVICRWELVENQALLP